MIFEIFGFIEIQILLQDAKDWIILIVNSSAEMYAITGRLFYIDRLIESMLLQNTQ